MAPELWSDSREAGPAADQYALAALAYEALTGRLAFPGGSVVGHRPRPRPGRGPAAGRGLSSRPGRGDPPGPGPRQPGGRYANVLELAQAFRKPRPSPRRRRRFPRLDDELRQRFLTGAPQPIAGGRRPRGARNLHQAREALQRAGAGYGLVRWAARDRRRSRVSAGNAASIRSRPALRCGSSAARASTPVRLGGRWPRADPALRRCARYLSRSPSWCSCCSPREERGERSVRGVSGRPLLATAARAHRRRRPPGLAREMPAVTRLLRALTFLLDYVLVVGRDGGGRVLDGSRRRPPERYLCAGGIEPGRPALIDGNGMPVAALWPLLQMASPHPWPRRGAVPAGRAGRQGARLISQPRGFEHQDRDLWDWFRESLSAADDGGGPPRRWTSALTAGSRPTPPTTPAGSSVASSETQVVVNRLRVQPFVAIVGPSGVGKSSFVQAGVIPGAGLAGHHRAPGTVSVACSSVSRWRRPACEAASPDVHRSTSGRWPSGCDAGRPPGRRWCWWSISSRRSSPWAPPARSRRWFAQLLLQVGRAVADPLRVLDRRCATTSSSG